MIPAVQYLTPSAGGGGKGSPSSPGLKNKKATYIFIEVQVTTKYLNKKLSLIVLGILVPKIRVKYT